MRRTPKTRRIGTPGTLLLAATLAMGGCSGYGSARDGNRLPPPPLASGPIDVDELLARARGEQEATPVDWSITLRYATGATRLSERERNRLKAHLVNLPGEGLQADLRAGPAAGRDDPAAGFRAMLRLRELGGQLPDSIAVRSARYLSTLPRDALQVILSPIGSDPRA